jgi:8-oxo-dGTP pyrophosphatase MutT (NUDIX family)
MRNVHVTVATVVERDGRFLFVEETIDGRTVINQPAGHWDPGETLVEAAVRETLEETGWDVRITGLLGVYEFEPGDLDYGFLRFAYAGEALRHHAGRKLDAGIERAVWLTREELQRESARHRSPMVQRCVEDYVRGQRYPLEMVAHLDKGLGPRA